MGAVVHVYHKSFVLFCHPSKTYSVKNTRQFNLPISDSQFSFKKKKK